MPMFIVVNAAISTLSHVTQRGYPTAQSVGGEGSNRRKQARGSSAQRGRADHSCLVLRHKNYNRCPYILISAMMISVLLLTRRGGRK